MNKANVKWEEFVGPGWQPIVTELVDLCRWEGVEIMQVKEKFGGLRFYVGPAPMHVHDTIAAAERKAAVTCEDCGQPGKLRGGSWIRTLCDEHAKGRGQA